MSLTSHLSQVFLHSDLLLLRGLDPDISPEFAADLSCDQMGDGGGGFIPSQADRCSHAAEVRNDRVLNKKGRKKKGLA